MLWFLFNSLRNHKEIMNSDSLSTLKRVETSDPFRGIPAERGENHFVNLPKDVLVLLEQGKVEQALALLKIIRGEDLSSHLSIWARLQNLFLSFFSITAIRKGQKHTAKPSIVGKNFKNVAIKLFHLLLHIPVGILKSFVFLIRMGKKGSELTNASLAALQRYTLQLGKSLLAIGKNFFWQPLQKMTAPLLTKCQQIGIKLTETWEALRNTTKAIAKKIKEKIKDTRQKIDDFLRPIANRIREYLVDPVVKYLKETVHQITQQMTQSAQSVVATVQPVINILAGFLTQKKEAVQYSLKQMGQRLGRMGKWLQYKAGLVTSRASRAIFEAFASSFQFFYQKSRWFLRWLLQKIVPLIQKGALFLWNIFAKVIFIASCIVIQIGKALLWFIVQSGILEKWGIIRISRKLSALFR